MNELKRSKNIYLTVFFGILIGQYFLPFFIGFLIGGIGNYETSFFDDIGRVYDSIMPWVLRTCIFFLTIWFGRKLYYFGVLLYLLALTGIMPVLSWGVFIMLMIRYRNLKKDFLSVQNDTQNTSAD